MIPLKADKWKHTVSTLYLYLDSQNIPSLLYIIFIIAL